MSARLSKTTRDVTINPFADQSPMFQPFVVPAGTEVMEITGLRHHVAWAVASEQLVAKLSGSAHDARYRYAFVPDDAVDADHDDEQAPDPENIYNLPSIQQSIEEDRK